MKKLKQKRLDDTVMEEPVKLPPGWKVFRNYQDAEGRCLGLVIECQGERVFWKKVNRYRHFMRIHRGWGIASFIIRQLPNDKVTKIVLDVEGESTIWVDYDVFIKKAVIDQYKHYEEQHFCHEYWWKEGYWREPL